MSAHASTSGSPLRDLAPSHRLAEAVDVAVGQLLVVEVEDLGRDELRLPDHPVERGVLGGEPEERREAAKLALGARRPALRRLGHRLPHAVVQVEDELVEDLLLEAKYR